MMWKSIALSGATISLPGRRSSSAPVRKDHLTDWLTENISKGIKLQSFVIEQLAIQVDRDTAIVH
jgi:hypothetical protein